MCAGREGDRSSGSINRALNRSTLRTERARSRARGPGESIRDEGGERERERECAGQGDCGSDTAALLVSRSIFRLFE